MTSFEHEECVREALQALREDITLLRLALIGAQLSIDDVLWRCLLRLTDYLEQHIGDICTLCRK